jgi:hypothetical protein
MVISLQKRKRGPRLANAIKRKRTSFKDEYPSIFATIDREKTDRERLENKEPPIDYDKLTCFSKEYLYFKCDKKNQDGTFHSYRARVDQRIGVKNSADQCDTCTPKTTTLFKDSHPIIFAQIKQEETAKRYITKKALNFQELTSKSQRNMILECPGCKCDINRQTSKLSRNSDKTVYCKECEIGKRATRQPSRLVFQVARELLKDGILAQLVEEYVVFQLFHIKYPLLFARIDQTKTKIAYPDVDLFALSISSDQPLYWKCNCNLECKCAHSFMMTIAHMIKSQKTKYGGCPYGAGQKICPCQSVFRLHSQLIRFLDVHELNLEEKWNNESETSQLRLPWKCGKHQWIMSIKQMVRNLKSGKNVCPGCRIRNRKGSRLLHETHHALFKRIVSVEDHSDLILLNTQSNKKITMLCPKSKCEHPHQYDTIVSNAVSGWDFSEHRGCPFCSGTRLDPCQSVAQLHPELKEYVVNQNLLLEYSTGSEKELQLKCPCCEYEWTQSVRETVNNILRETELCAQCRAQQSQSLIDFLNEKNVDSIDIEASTTLNPGLDFSQITIGSSDKIFILCNKSLCHHLHIFLVTVSALVRSLRLYWKSAGCPFCSGKESCECHNLWQHQHLRRFLDETKSKELFPLLNIEQLSTGSKYQLPWRCENGHTWTMECSRMSLKEERDICAQCNSLKWKRPDLWEEVDLDESQRLHPGLDLTFLGVSSSKALVWNPRDCGHDSYTKVIQSRTDGGQGCPQCASSRSKGEKMMDFVLKKLLEQGIIQSFGKKALKYDPTKRALWADEFVTFPDSSTSIMEYDGLQHFQDVEYFHSTVRDNYRRDQLKNKYCRDNKIPLLRMSHLVCTIEEVEHWITTFFKQIRENPSEPILLLSHPEEYEKAKELAINSMDVDEVEDDDDVVDIQSDDEMDNETFIE